LADYPSPFAAYNEVLGKYSEWLISKRAEGWIVIDIHGPMNRFLMDRRRADPGFILASDGVHPNATGHWLIAREVIRHYGGEERLVSGDTPQALLSSHPEAAEVIKLVQQRQRLLKDAWLTEVGHLRPGMNKGEPLVEAREEAARLAGRVMAVADVQFPGKRSRWFGFERFDFEVSGKPVLVVAPKHPAPGRPWVWHGEFFGHKPDPDLALLGKGFHVVHMSVPDMLGSPEAVRLWNDFYRKLIETHGFAKKAALVGLSRGSLYCYNWAITNPDKVTCIYGDAPVCDFRSWPGAFGKGKRSDRDWQLVLKCYGFKSDVEAKAYRGNPVDSLAPLAEAKVPLLHVYGEADEVVPWDENTRVVAERYRKLGGDITLIPKPGVKHHPHGLEDSTPIVDFIWNNTASTEARAWLARHGGGPIGEQNRPLMRKLGTIDLDLVETTPVVLNGRLWRFEWVRQGLGQQYWDNQRATNYFRFRDPATGEVTAPFADGHEFGSAFVEGDTAYVTGTHGRTKINMFASRDLKNWQSWPVLDNPRYGIFNTSICKANDEFVLMFEIDRPKEETGTPFTARFAKSSDLITWKLTPSECNYAKDRYTAPHCLRWLDGWFYNFYLEAHQGYEMRVVRSKDLINWEESVLNPVLRASPEDRVIASVKLSDAQRTRIAHATNMNNSDIDFCEWRGHLRINYSWGNQQGTEHLAEAVYNGSLAQFLRGWFPQ
jgi:pimeloyl-ACP methyl ester carboxylesterase